jgi:putative transposase
MAKPRPEPTAKVIKQPKKKAGPSLPKPPRLAKVPSYTRAYKHSLAGTNWGKVETVLDLFQAYISLAASLRAQQMHLFFTTGQLDRNAVPQSPKAPCLKPLSARYQQTCQYQVVAMLSSSIALRQDDFRRIVMRSSLCGAVTRELLTINRLKAWYKPGTRFDPAALRLAQNIMRQLFKQHRLPNVKSINLALDEKVAVLDKPNKPGHFPWWLKLATLKAGKPIYLPVESNQQFDQAGGQRSAFVQLNLSAESGLSVALLKEFKQKAYTPRTPVVALDSGLSVFYATDQGDLLGHSIFGKLKQLDAQIVACASGRQSRGLRIRCPRYDALVARVRGLLACEIGRIFNTLVARLAPAEIVMESLDFRDSQMSRRMNRLIRNFGRGVVREKLTALADEYAIVVTHVPAAYTSQACPDCHHTQRGNRVQRAVFSCLHCGLTRHADAVGALNIRSRRSWPEVQANLGCFMRREVVLSRLGSAHLRWCAQQSAVRKKGSLKRLPEPDPKTTHQRC